MNGALLRSWKGNLSRRPERAIGIDNVLSDAGGPVLWPVKGAQAPACGVDALQRVARETGLPLAKVSRPVFLSDRLGRPS